MAEMVMEAKPEVPPSSPPPPRVRARLEDEFGACDLLRPFRRSCYDAGARLSLAVTGVVPANTGRIEAEVERFVGGGFAGQVYRVVLREVQPDDGPLVGLEVGQRYAIKILRPPSGMAALFRDVLYFLAYQGAFSAEVNPAAVRVGVLWQKLIRRAAAERLGEPTSVCDTFATFYDDQLHSFGEINEWVSGRIWKFEVDQHVIERWEFKGEPPADIPSAEYVHKRLFMRDLVRLLHDMGAGELARQYEWWTCKSQPNALKRLGNDHSPRAGLTAIDFRAGLALLPFLPMSPADFWLILRGLRHGRLVQFDRSDLPRLHAFIDEHREEFADLQPAVNELVECETIHRRSLPDITHHHVRLLSDGSLRRDVRAGAITGWQHKGRIDEEHAEQLRRRGVWCTLLWFVSLVPLLGKAVLKLWGHSGYRAHLGRMLSNWSYFMRALRGSRIEVLCNWHRQGRISDERALRLVRQPVRFWLQRILIGWLPARWHRMIAEPSYGWKLVQERFSFVLRFLVQPQFREEWLLEQVHLGREEGMLTDDEAAKIAHQVHDPFIQKYLLCVAAHLCTVPVTQIVIAIVWAVIITYDRLNGIGWTATAARGAFWAVAIQTFPISPGSMARGLFVLFMMVRDRDIKNYYIAAPVSFIHVVGYLAFPLQMVAHDPALARFLAGRWARSAVHVIPVFGEKGALAEHAVFDLFFNVPLSFQERFRTRPLLWSIWLGLLGAALVLLGYGAYTQLHAWL
ncbi:MAG: hypothetical protein PVJ57_07825 [Phycisphaerae bacterium]|jgi:hypothetical protein